MNKILKRTLITVGAVLGCAVLAVGGYAVYLIASYNRIGNQTLAVDTKATATQAKVGETYTAVSYNIGFGAYSQDYTFFMDEGYDAAGNKTCGHYGKAKSKETVEFNTNGAILTAQKQNPDFVMFQEVDTRSTRSHVVNQDQRIKEAFATYDHVHCVNFHTAFLPLPLYDMHGESHSGLTTVSRFKITAAERKEYTVTDSLSKLFDLDRCFSVQKVAVENGKSLYVVNSHMSAYTNPAVREKQVQEMNAFLQSVKDAGDYVIVGGDFNHDLLTNNPEFPYTEVAGNRPFGETKKNPDWISQYFDKDGKSPLIEGFKVVASDNAPSCRNNDIEYEPGKTYICMVDGFIVSNNIEVVAHETVQTQDSRKEYGNKGYAGFAYSDHDPVKVQFKLL